MSWKNRSGNIDTLLQPDLVLQPSETPLPPQASEPVTVNGATANGTATNAATTANANRANGGAAGKRSSAPIEAKTVLVVDDSINVRRFLAHTLESAGYRIEQAKDGRAAVDKLNSGLSVEAVLCDIEMPRLDGYGFLAEIKTQPQFKRLPVIMLTSRSGDKHRQMAMSLGACDYFTKPYQDHELLKALTRHLSLAVR